MLNMIEAACFSHVGKVRSNNEDNFYFNNMPELFTTLPRMWLKAT